MSELAGGVVIVTPVGHAGVEGMAVPHVAKLSLCTQSEVLTVRFCPLYKGNAALHAVMCVATFCCILCNQGILSMLVNVRHNLLVHVTSGGKQSSAPHTLLLHHPWLAGTGGAPESGSIVSVR